MKLWIKICGTTNLQDATLAWEAGADAIGFVFAHASKRLVTVKDARQIIEELARPVERIAVVADVELDELLRIYRESGVSGMQLHGHEPPEMICELRQRLPGARIIKALHITASDALEHDLERYQKSGADALLLDHAPQGRGGTGTSFDWQCASAFTQAEAKLPIIIAGGLTPSNVAGAIATFHPFGVDVVSGVERFAGSKDPEKLRAFIAAARAAAEQLTSAKAGTA